MALDVDRVREIAERVAASSGLEVVAVEFLGAGNARMLRVFLDKPPSETAALQGLPDGVTHEDCANFSREFGTILDVEDAVPGSYTLEVSSPGLDRKLSGARDFQRFTGSLVKLVTRQPVNGQNSFEGRLQSFDGARLTLSVEPPRSKKKQKHAPAHGQIEIELANVDRANLVPEI